nr:MAG: RNA-dependent RNA polymerase [Bat faecal associated arto-like virus 1]
MMASACERNLGDQILPLFKQQSMTLSGAQLKHKMDVLATLPETETHTWIRFNMDLEQWNYTFRTFQQSFILDTLCALFDVNHFRYLTHIFTDSLLISANKFAPPGMPDVFTHWDCHAGGNQGILQKLWTLITIIIIRKVMYTMDLDHRLTGSGDNQVLFIRLVKDPQIRTRIDNIRRQLSEAFSDVGLALKLEETWFSNNLTCYQRTYYLNGAKIINGLKQAGRAFSGSGDINAGINAIVTTAVNGGVGLTEYQSDPILGPAFTLLEILVTLLGDVNYRDIVPLDSRRLVVLTFLSSDFGFLPMQQLTSYLYAGHQDTLSESLSLLQYLWDNYPHYRGYVSGAIKFNRGGSDLESMLQLILEPTALNISRPRLPEALIRDKVESFLTNPSAVNNTQLKLMFQASQKEDQLRLAQELLKIRPVNTSLIHSLFEYSHIGSLLGTLSRFNRISSIVKLVGMNKDTSTTDCFSKQVRELDLRNLKYFFSRIRTTNWSQSDFIGEVICGMRPHYNAYCHKHQVSPTCIFTLRVFLISYTYNLPDEFITGPYTPPPTEQLQFIDDPNHRLGESDLIITPSFNIPDTLAGVESKRGCYALYIGSRTADPVKSIKLTALEGVEVGTAIRTMLKTLAWIKSTNSDSTVSNFIKEQLGARMIGLEGLLDQLVPGTAGGNINHRFGGPGAIMWAFSNSTTLISTWYMITSNRAVALQRGEEDRFVFFQQLFHHIYGVLRFCSPYHRKIYAKVRLDHCSYLIPDARYTSPIIHVPGRDKLFGGLILDEPRRLQLLQEAEHFTRVMSNSLLKQLTGVEVLSGVIGYEITLSVIRFSIGEVGLSQEEHVIPSIGTDINLTLLRKVPLADLLLSFTLHMAIFGQFGPRITPVRLKNVLQRRSALGLMGQSATPLVSFLNALITSGKINQLLHLGKTWWEWDGSRSIISLISPLLRAMACCFVHWMDSPSKIIIIVEIKTLSYNYTKLLRFLKNWSPKIARVLSQNQYVHPVRQLELINQLRYPLKLLLVTDVGIATEFGRRVFDSAEAQPRSVGGTDDNQTLLPNFHTIPNPNWFCVTIPSHHSREEHTHNQGHSTRALLPPIAVSKNLTRLTRWNCGPSMGAPKLASLIETEHIELKQGELVVTLAEGLGSYLSYLLHRFPDVVGIYNSKIIPDNTPVALAGLYVPPSLLCPCNCTRRVLNLPESWSEFGDLLKERTWTEISQAVNDSALILRLLTLDMEYQPDNSRSVLLHLLKFLQHYKPAHCIIKLTYTEIHSDCTSELALLGQLYDSCKLVKPVLSNPGSEEVFLVCSGALKVTSHKRIDVESALRSGQHQLIINWNKERRGQVLIEAMETSGSTRYCPGYLSPGLRYEMEANGLAYAIIHPYVSQLFDLTYRRYYRQQELNRTEQIVTKSSSQQATSTESSVWSLIAVVYVYIKVTGGQLGTTGVDAATRAIRQDPDPFLDELDKIEKEAPQPKAWKHVVRMLAALIVYTKFQIPDLDVLIIEWLVRLLLYNDRFGMVNDASKSRLIEVKARLTRASPWCRYTWFTAFLDPGMFLVADQALQWLIKRTGWRAISLRCSVTMFDKLVQELPWSVSLVDRGDPRVMIVSAPYREIEETVCKREIMFIYFDVEGAETEESIAPWKRAREDLSTEIPTQLWYYLPSL